MEVASIEPAHGVVTRVNGPLVEIDGLAEVAALFDLVEVGGHRLPGEIVALRDRSVTAQIYEYTGGLAPGAPAWARSKPLSARLSPALLGGVFDGLLRPLLGAPTWLHPGARASREEKAWDFVPRAALGARVAAGAIIGELRDAIGRTFPALAPPGVDGALTWLAGPGPVDMDSPLARVAEAEISAATSWPVRRPRPFLRRIEEPVPLVTGQRVLDLLHPVSKGSTAAVVGGFGTGKTMLLQQIAKWCDAGVIVYVGCGERGNELADTLDELRSLEDPRTGRPLVERTVIIANTSNMAVMAREASIYTGITVAEYFRDLGNDAVVIADSTSRWAEALRESASRTGQLPAEEGYPAGLASSLAAFYERAGRVETLSGASASVTVIAAVSPPGGDTTEPVTAHTQRFVRCLWGLDRDLAYARHYPAVAWRASFSRDAAPLAVWHVREGDPAWGRRRARLESLLAEADRLASMAELVGVGALPGRERMMLLGGRLVRQAVLQQSALSRNDGYCTLPKQAALADAVLAVHDCCLALVERGVPATVVEETDFGPLVRARDELAPDDAAGIARVRDAVLVLLEASA